MSKKSSSSTTKPWKAAQPYILGAASGLQSAFDGNAGNVASLSANLNAELPGIQANTLHNPAVAAGQGYNTDVLSGKYLTGNPYLQGQIDQTADDTQNRVNGSIGAFGRTGGDAHSQILARELAKAENTLRYTDYNSERDRMGQAANSAGSLASTQNQGLAAYLASLTTAADLPTSNAQGLAQSLGALLNGYKTTTQQNSGLDNILNTVSALSGAYKSVAGAGK